MEKKQIAHGLAVAYMVGKDLPTEELVAEYNKKYDETILKFKQKIESENRQRTIASAPPSFIPNEIKEKAMIKCMELGFNPFIKGV